MSTKHTSGPWFLATPGADSTNDGDRSIYAKVGPHNNPLWIARVYGEGILEAPSSERVANARLIAAAPELLDACRAALETLSCFVTPHDEAPREGCECARCEIAGQLRAAIAKAEGSKS